MKIAFLPLAGLFFSALFFLYKWRISHFKKINKNLTEEINKFQKVQRILKDANDQKKIRDESREKNSDVFDDTNPYDGLRGSNKK